MTKNKNNKMGTFDLLENANYKHNKKEVKTKVGETQFIKDQYEEGVAKKLKGASCTSVFYVHGSK